jgi:hypothetical protein
MNEPRPQSPARKTLTILGLVGAIVVVLIAAAIGKVVGRQGTKALFNRDSTSVTAHFTEAQWQRRTLQDISLQSPFDFDVGPDVSARIPQAVRDAIEYFEIFQNRGGGTFGVTISRFAYKPHVEVSLDGTVQGAMTQAAAAAGDSDPQYSSTTTTISGLEARRASYQGKVSGRTMQIEAAFIRRGQKFWQVQVIFLSPSSAGDASRILESITITP